MNIYQNFRMIFNTINNKFFEDNPDKVLGEFSIAPYMNKIIVKGNKNDVVEYFSKLPKESIKKTESTTEQEEPMKIKNKFPKHYKAQEGKYGSGDKSNQSAVSQKAPDYEKQIVKVEGFKVLTIEDTVKKYTPQLSDNDIMAFVWYNQTLGIPMTGWEKWFIKGAGENVIKAKEDVEYLNQQFKTIGKFQSGDVIGKKTRFNHSYNGVMYSVFRKIDGQLVLVDDSKTTQSNSADNVSIEQLKPLVLSGSLFYLNGDYVPLHVYSNTDYEVLKNQLELDKEHIISNFGEGVYDDTKNYLVMNQMRVDAPLYQDRFKLNPYSEIAKETTAGLIESDDESESKKSVTQAFEDWVQDLKNSEFHLCTKEEFRRIIIWGNTRARRGSTDEEKEAMKGIIANCTLEANRLFSEFCVNALDSATKAALNRRINLEYNRSMLINTSKVPVGFVCSNKFKSGNFSLKPVQIEAIKFAISRNNWCLALTVGFGKTSTAIATISYLISSGTIKKPFVIVPKPVLENWLKEMKGYWFDEETNRISFTEKKNWKFSYGILTGTDLEIINVRNLSAKFRKIAKEIPKKKSCITLGTYEALSNMYIGDESIRMFVIEEWKTILTGERNETGRQWATKMAALESSLNKVDRDAEIDIQEMNFDSMFFDEAHRLKNMFSGVQEDTSAKIKSSFKGTSSNRALRGFYLTMYLQKNNGRIGFLTATPFSNTPLEVYTMMCFLNYKELSKNNINRISKFVELFFNETVEPVVTKDNKIQYQSVMKNYKNKGILNTLLLNTFIYKDNPTEAGLSRPCIVRYPNNQFKLMLRMSTLQKLQRDLLVGDIPSVMNFIAENKEDVEMSDYAHDMLSRYQDNIASKKGKALGGIIVTSSKISALSPFASSPVSISFKSNEWWRELYDLSPKIKFTVDCINNMYQYQIKRGETPSSFLIYCEVGVNILPYFKEALEHVCGFKRNVGVEQDEDEKNTYDEVEIIEGTADTDKEANRRDRVSTLFNKGKVKVIIGTSTIKEGINLQENCATLFILTPSWNSTDINQVEGRIHRQGNKYGYARVITPVVSRTMDSFIYQKYEEKKSRLADIWKNDGKSDSEDLNIEIKAEKQKELILDDAAQIGKIRSDLSARAKMNAYNKATEDFNSVSNAIRKSGQFTELLNYHLDKTQAMLDCATQNKDVIVKILDLITKDENVKSSVRGLKSRLETLIGYYDELILKLDNANKTKAAVDLVNILDRSYNSRTYYVTQQYDVKLELKEYLIDNGFKRIEIENLFENDIFAKVEVYTKLDTYDSKFNYSLRKLKELYGSSVLAERMLNAEGLSMSSNQEDLDLLIERYKVVVDSIKSDIETNINIVKSRDSEVLVPKPEYIEKLVNEAKIELEEENKYAQSSDILGDIFSNETNHLLTYLKDDVDLSKCEVKTSECCETNGKTESVITKVEAFKFPDILNDIMPKHQIEVLESIGYSEHEETLNRLADIASSMNPKNDKGKDTIMYLHYFYGGADWYIAEWDKENGIFYGFANIGDDINAEFGSVFVSDLVNNGSIELDFYFIPTEIKNIKVGGNFYYEEEQESKPKQEPIVDQKHEEVDIQTSSRSNEEIEQMNKEIAELESSLSGLQELETDGVVELMEGDELAQYNDAVGFLKESIAELKKALQG